MATLLLVIIYVAFVGMGTPDSLFGTAWPVMYREFALPLSYAGIASMIGAAGTVVSSLMSGRVINRFGTGRVVAVSTAMTALGLLGYRYSPYFWCICLCAIPMGLGAGSIDTALNNYVALHYPPAQVSYLHCFYGVGVMLSPYFMSLVITGPKSWRGGYEIMFFVQAAIAIICIAAIPLWGKVKALPKDGQESEPEPEQRVIPLKKLAKMPDVRAMWIILLTSMGIECTCGAWAATYLVDYKLMAADAAAEIMVVYFAGMTVGRFLSGLLSKRYAGWKMIFMGIAVMAVAMVLLLLPLGAGVAAVALFLIGMGNGPMYPNITHLTPITFGRDVSQSVVGSQMAFANIGAMLLPPFFGVLGRYLGVNLLPWYLLVLFVLMVYSSVFCARRSAK